MPTFKVITSGTVIQAHYVRARNPEQAKEKFYAGEVDDVDDIDQYDTQISEVERVNPPKRTNS